MAVWWRGAELDARLASGADPWTSEALALRADRITTPRHRVRVAEGLAGARRSARRDRLAFTAAVRPNSSDVLESNALIAAIERRLRGGRPVTAQGVAIVRGLLIDGNSALYGNGEPGTLSSQLRAAAAALDAPDPRIWSRP